MKHDLHGEVVLVAGGCGFIGSTVVRTLLDEGARVVVYDNLLHGRREHVDDLGAGVTIVCGDVLDEWRVCDAFRQHAPSFVIDLVSDTYVPTAYEFPRRFVRTNIEGTLSILQAVRLFGVRRLVHVSTTEVYGDVDGPIRETQPVAPLNTYAVTKLAAEQLCQSFVHEHRVQVVVARLFNTYGPRATHPYVIPEILSQLEKSAHLTLGNLEARRDFTYVDDAARALVGLLRADVPNGEVFNVGSGAIVSVRELVAILGELTGRGHPVVTVDPERFRRRDIAAFRCDASKLAAAIGWKPTTSLRDGLAATIEWFRANGRRWSWEGGAEGR